MFESKPTKNEPTIQNKITERYLAKGLVYRFWLLLKEDSEFTLVLHIPITISVQSGSFTLVYIKIRQEWAVTFPSVRALVNIQKTNTKIAQGYRMLQDPMN